MFYGEGWFRGYFSPYLTMSNLDPDNYNIWVQVYLSHIRKDWFHRTGQKVKN